MLSTAEARTAYWHLGERSLMHHVTQTVERAGPDALKQAADRYGTGGGQHGLMPGLSPRRRAAAMHSLGKRMLKVDGFHRTFAWLYRDDEQVATLVLDPEDQQDKVVKIRRLAQEVEGTGADTVLFTTEAWFAPELDDEDPRATLRASQRDDRREALATYLLRRNGDHAAWITLFGRDRDGGVVLGDTEEQSEFPPRAIVRTCATCLGGVADPGLVMHPAPIDAPVRPAGARSLRFHAFRERPAATSRARGERSRQTLAGALGVGLLGDYFPEDDPADQDARSIEFLTRFRPVIARERAEVVNLDCTIFCVTPQIGPAVPQMRANIAAGLQCSSPDQINVKGKTNDGFGPEGHGETISATVVVQLQLGRPAD